MHTLGPGFPSSPNVPLGPINPWNENNQKTIVVLVLIYQIKFNKSTCTWLIGTETACSFILIEMKYTVFQAILPQVLLVQDHQESL